MSLKELDSKYKQDRAAWFSERAEGVATNLRAAGLDPRIVEDREDVFHCSRGPGIEVDIPRVRPSGVSTFRFIFLENHEHVETGVRVTLYPAVSREMKPNGVAVLDYDMPDRIVEETVASMVFRLGEILDSWEECSVPVTSFSETDRLTQWARDRDVLASWAFGGVCLEAGFGGVEDCADHRISASDGVLHVYVPANETKAWVAKMDGETFWISAQTEADAAAGLFGFADGTGLVVGDAEIVEATDDELEHYEMVEDGERVTLLEVFRRDRKGRLFASTLSDDVRRREMQPFICYEGGATFWIAAYDKKEATRHLRGELRSIDPASTRFRCRRAEAAEASDDLLDDWTIPVDVEVSGISSSPGAEVIGYRTERVPIRQRFEQVRDSNEAGVFASTFSDDVKSVSKLPQKKLETMRVVSLDFARSKSHTVMLTFDGESGELKCQTLDPKDEADGSKKTLELRDELDDRLHNPYRDQVREARNREQTDDSEGES